MHNCKQEDYIMKTKESLITAANCMRGSINIDGKKKLQKKKKRNARNTNIWIFHTTKWPECTPEDLDIATKGKTPEGK